MSPDQALGSINPLLVQMENLLCERFKELGHQYAQVREEIVAHVGNVITDSKEQDPWDLADFIWRLLKEWETSDLTNKVFPRPAPSKPAYRVEVGRIESLRYLPKKSSIGAWDHACLCAGELLNTLRQVMGLPDKSFKGILAERRIEHPVGNPPQDAVVVAFDSDARAFAMPLVDGDMHSWGEYIDRLESELVRARKAITTVNRQNLEMAVRLSETQNELHGARRSFGYYASS